MSGLPTGWAEVELGEVWHESRARTRPDAIAQTDYVGLGHVESGTNRILAKGRSGDVRSAVAVFSVGDVLYGRLRPYLNKVIRPGFAGVASTEFLVFKETQTLANAFLMHLLSRSDLVGYASANSAGVNLPRVSAKRLAKYRFPLAPLPEQHRIVAKIESLFAKLDEGIAALKRAQANLERYRASVLKATVEGRLTERWRRENPPGETGEELLQRILAERRKRWEEEQLAKFAAKGRKPPRNWKAKYKEPVAPDTNGLPELPEGWCWVGIEHLIAFIPYALKAGPFGSALKKSFYVETGYKIYGQEQVLRGDPHWGGYYIDEDRFCSLKNCAVRPGDLLISLVGTIGRTLVLPEDIEPGIINPRLIKVSLNGEVAVPEFFQAYLRSPRVRQILKRVSHGGTMDVLNMTTLKAVAFPLPPLAEQKFIVQLLSDSSVILDGMETSFSNSARCAAALRQSILKRAFEGRLVPQDPADEPASVLLERIRAEREAERKRSRRRPTRRKRQPRSRVP